MRTRRIEKTEEYSGIPRFFVFLTRLPSGMSFRKMKVKRDIVGWIAVIVFLLTVGCGHREQADISVDGFLAVEHPDSAGACCERWIRSG